jgi:hypothetical protein
MQALFYALKIPCADRSPLCVGTIGRACLRSLLKLLSILIW